MGSTQGASDLEHKPRSLGDDEESNRTLATLDFASRHPGRTFLLHRGRGHGVACSERHAYNLPQTLHNLVGPVVTHSRLEGVGKLFLHEVARERRKEASRSAADLPPADFRPPDIHRGPAHLPGPAVLIDLPPAELPGLPGVADLPSARLFNDESYWTRPYRGETPLAVHVVGVGSSLAANLVIF